MLEVANKAVRAMVYPPDLKELFSDEFRAMRDSIRRECMGLWRASNGFAFFGRLDYPIPLRR